MVIKGKQVTFFARNFNKIANFQAEVAFTCLGFFLRFFLWNSEIQVTSCMLRVRIYVLRVQINELVSCVHTHLHYLVSCFWQRFCLTVSSFICRNLTLPLFKKEVFAKNGYFFSSKINFCRHDISSFYLQ